MKITAKIKEQLKQEIRESLSAEKEVNKIVVFGSFVKSANPNDVDIAIYQDSDESYLTLAMKYRKLTRQIAKKIAVDIIPIKANVGESWFLSEIEAGELIYER
jgi:predicted nucleotidyltransferase